MKTRSCGIVFFLVMTISCFFVSTAFCALFFADMVETGPEGTVDSKIIVQDDRYRIDIKEKQKNIRIIVDRSKGKTWILVPSDKIVVEKNINSLSNLMRNPFSALRYVTEKYDSKEVGHEFINGYQCTKIAVFIRGREAMTAWIPDKLEFPVRIINLRDHSTVDLRNISEKQVKDDFFHIPPDFKKMSKMPIPPPEWAKEIPSSPVLTPPFEKEFSVGSIIRIKPVRGYYLNSKISNSLNGEPSRFTVVAFKNGHPLKDPSYSTYTIKRTGEKINATNKARPGQADEIVIRVAKGKIKVRAGWEEASEDILSNRFHLPANQSIQFDIDSKKASRLVLTDTASDGQASRGVVSAYMEEAHDMADGTTVFKKKEQQKIPFNLLNGQSQSWKFPRERKIGAFGISLSEGAVDIRSEQPRRSGDIPPSWAKNNAGITAHKVEAAKAVTTETAPARPVKSADSVTAGS